MGAARMTEMIETARAVRGDGWAAVVWATVHVRVAMHAFDNALQEDRLVAARQLMNGVRQLAADLKLAPGELAEALRHARVVYREGFER